jgi:hypothetical protein
MVGRGGGLWVAHLVNAGNEATHGIEMFATEIAVTVRLSYSSLDFSMLCHLLI